MLDRKSCEEFRSTGLLLFINQFLHIFGWVIVVESKPGEKSIMYPARTKFRGFTDGEVSKAYIKISEYMNENSEDLVKESKD